MCRVELSLFFSFSFVVFLLVPVLLVLPYYMVNKDEYNFTEGQNLQKLAMPFKHSDFVTEQLSEILNMRWKCR